MTSLSLRRLNGVHVDGRTVGFARAYDNGCDTTSNRTTSRSGEMRARKDGRAFGLVCK